MIHKYGDLNESSKVEQLHQATLLKRVEAERRARRIVVPTSEDEVRKILRRLGQPVKLFGESAADVRERLRDLLARVEIEGDDRDLLPSLLNDEVKHVEKKDESEVYTRATSDLLQWRRQRASISFKLASERLVRQRERRDNPTVSTAYEKDVYTLYKSAQNLHLSLSQFADPRPLSRIRCLGIDEDVLIASVAWSGSLKVWKASDELNAPCFETICSEHRITGLDWDSSSCSQPQLVIGLADGTAQVWRNTHENQFALIRTLEKGHAQRLGHVLFLDRRTIATAGFDHTWRLWDIETGTELLLQDGHSAEVYSLASHPDGSLLATGDFSGAVHVWDLRAGVKVHSFTEHSGKVLCADFNLNGYNLASGSDDHTVRIWDLRRRSSQYTIPAHSSLISDLRFFGEELLATSAFDGSLAIWNARDFKPLRSFASAHDGKTMSIDFLPLLSSRCVSLVSAGFDRTIKLWK